MVEVDALFGKEQSLQLVVLWWLQNVIERETRDFVLKLPVALT